MVWLQRIQSTLVSASIMNVRFSFFALFAYRLGVVYIVFLLLLLGRGRGGKGRVEE